MKFENYGVVYCCDRDDDCVRYDYGRNVFYIDLEAGPGIPYIDNVEYCPWCGILLDVNLIQQSEESDCSFNLNISNDDLIRAWNYGDKSYSVKGK